MNFKEWFSGCLNDPGSHGGPAHSAASEQKSLASHELSNIAPYYACYLSDLRPFQHPVRLRSESPRCLCFTRKQHTAIMVFGQGLPDRVGHVLPAAAADLSATNDQPPRKYHLPSKAFQVVSDQVQQKPYFAHMETKVL